MFPVLKISIYYSFGCCSFCVFIPLSSPQSAPVHTSLSLSLSLSLCLARVGLCWPKSIRSSAARRRLHRLSPSTDFEIEFPMNALFSAAPGDDASLLDFSSTQICRRRPPEPHGPMARPPGRQRDPAVQRAHQIRQISLLHRLVSVAAAGTDPLTPHTHVGVSVLRNLRPGKGDPFLSQWCSHEIWLGAFRDLNPQSRSGQGLGTRRSL